MNAITLRQARAVLAAHEAKQDKVERVIWCDRGWQPVYYGFCPSKRAWVREMKRFGHPTEPYPTNDGCATTFVNKGKTSIIVTLGDKSEERQTRVEIAGLLCHEATHVWQEVRRAIGEREPSIEFEAYSVQAIFQSLYQAWLDTRAPDAMKAACAQRIKTGGER